MMAMSATIACLDLIHVLHLHATAPVVLRLPHVCRMKDSHSMTLCMKPQAWGVIQPHPPTAKTAPQSLALTRAAACH